MKMNTLTEIRRALDGMIFYQDSEQQAYLRLTFQNTVYGVYNSNGRINKMFEQFMADGVVTELTKMEREGHYDRHNYTDTERSDCNKNMRLFKMTPIARYFQERGLL